ncbi:SET and MYND domain-containing protein 3 [Podochytrium sp. JEL0797]|nr:SET and MYND domain-containing protein 3 [Podochytrium sp. JEL0797]
MKSASINAQPIPGKGNGFVSYDPELTSARLLFRARQLESTAHLLKNLFPATLDLIPHPRRSQIPESVTSASLRLVTAWEQTTPPPTTLPPPTRDDILRFYFVVECNSFPTGLLVTLSYANHSCDPNCEVFEHDPAEPGGLPLYSLTSKRAIRVGEEITISYIDLVANVELCEDRQRRLEEHFLFRCRCEWCCAPLEREGLLLLESEDDTKPLTGPKFEDLLCSAFPWEGTCPGAVGLRSGVCSTCHHAATQKQLDNIQNKSDRLVLSLRRTLIEVNEFLNKIEEEANRVRQREASSVSNASTNSSIHRPVSSSSRSTTTTEGETRLTNAATIKELHRLLKLVRGFETRLEDLVHASHVAFGPMRACLGKLERAIAVHDALRVASAGKKRKGVRVVGGVIPVRVDDVEVEGGRREEVVGIEEQVKNLAI